MKKAGFDSLFINNRYDIRYITGFDCDYGFLLFGKTGSFFLTSGIYKVDAQNNLREPFRVVEIKKSLTESLSRFDTSFWGKKTGYNPNDLTCFLFKKLNTILPFLTLKPVAGLIEEFRETKKPSELQAIIKAQRITESVFDEALDFIKEGISEIDIACEIDYRFRKMGGEGSAFPTIVASGPNSAKPHAVPSPRKITAHDIILFDMGTIADGYASDMTRTVFFGKADSEQKKIYQLVLDAQSAAIESISAGVKCSKIYKKARKVFEKEGYAEKFIHSLGHGVGLEVHESPRLSPGNSQPLKANSVITVEPGLYIPKWGGIRIEDMVVVEDDGCRNLTDAPKLLLEL